MSPTTIDRARLRLKKVRCKEVREPVSVQDALQLLRPQIIRPVRLGYQLKEIAEFLADDGKGGGIAVDAQALADVVAAGRSGPGTSRRVVVWFDIERSGSGWWLW